MSLSNKKLSATEDSIIFLLIVEFLGLLSVSQECVSNLIYLPM